MSSTWNCGCMFARLKVLHLLNLSRPTPTRFCGAFEQSHHFLAMVDKEVGLDSTPACLPNLGVDCDFIALCSSTCWQLSALRLVSMVCWPRVPCVGLLPVTGHLMLCRRSRLVVGDRWLLRVAGHHVLCWRSCLARANGQIMHYSLDVLYVAGSHSLLELVIK